MELFHFIRPWWLLAFIPVVLFVVLLFRHSGKSNSWAKYCDAHLLEHVLVGRETKAKKSLLPISVTTVTFRCVGLLLFKETMDTGQQS